VVELACEFKATHKEPYRRRKEGIGSLIPTLGESIQIRGIRKEHFVGVQIGDDLAHSPQRFELTRRFAIGGIAPVRQQIPSHATLVREGGAHGVFHAVRMNAPEDRPNDLIRGAEEVVDQIYTV